MCLSLQDYSLHSLALSCLMLRCNFPLGTSDWKKNNQSYVRLVLKTYLQIFYAAAFCCLVYLLSVTYWRNYTMPLMYKNPYFFFFSGLNTSTECFILYRPAPVPTVPAWGIILELKKSKWNIIINAQSRIFRICIIRNILLITFYSSYLLPCKITPICFVRWMEERHH